jgi:putative endonuclease
MSTQILNTQSLDTLDSIRSALLNPNTNPRSLGLLGEEFVTCWLKVRGWIILDRNFNSRYGELDVIALDVDGVLVFIEVKTRRSTLCGTPLEAVTQRKQMHLRSAASQWMLIPEHRCRHRGIRFDVVALLLVSGAVTVQHVTKAF